MARRTLKTVLFLGTGNDSRCRVAEALFNSVAGKMGLPWRAASKGLLQEREGHNSDPTAASAIKALAVTGDRAADVGGRPPAQVTTEDLETVDRVVALSQVEQRRLMQERFPAWIGKVEFWQVDDTSDAQSLLEQEIMGLVARILGGGERQETRPMQNTTPKRSAAMEPAKKPVTLKVGRETSGRRGKGVTTVFDVPLDENGLKELATILKQRCGTGGTVKDGRIEIQGDQRERVVAELEKLGYKVKRAGG
jgi:translation initiation factor 1